VLNVCLSREFLDRLPRFALIEHQIVKGDDRLLIALETIVHRFSPWGAIRDFRGG
jgi:hypothetical protein